MASIEQTRPRPPQRPPPPTTSLSRSQEITNIESFRELQKAHDIAHKLVTSALEEDERNNSQDALKSYKEGLRLIELVLRMDVNQLDCSQSEDKLDQAKLMQQKMTKTKQQVTFRLQNLRGNLGQQNNCLESQDEADAPPCYEEALRTPTAPPEFMDDEMMRLGDSIMSAESDRLSLTDADHLFSIEEGVQIFYISPDGLVSAPSYPSSLHIVKLPEQDNQTAFIHVNDWVYPLVPGSSPALRTNYGAYIFPDLMSSQHGAAVGLMLPDNVSASVRQQFEQVVSSLSVYETEPDTTSQSDEATGSSVVATAASDEQTVQKVPQARSVQAQQGADTATRISKGIVVAADWIAWGLNKGAEVGGHLLKAGSEKIREKTSPSSKDHKVDPRVKKGLVYARQATHVSVQVTSYLVSKLGEATCALARELAPHVKEKGGKFVPDSVKKTDASGKSKLDGVVQVAASGLHGFGTVYMSLESAAKLLGKNLANETVQLVHHKYGQEAGQAAEHSMYTAGNAAMTAFNANNFGVKAIAKRAAKDTGKAVLADLNKGKEDNRGYVSCEPDNDHSSSRNENEYRQLGGPSSSNYSHNSNNGSSSGYNSNSSSNNSSNSSKTSHRVKK